ncbi:MAG: hypothetical protein Q8S20_20345 [Sulfuritalea sp.]|nr:hypothetical protein [Sulfuritalea sp.]
MSSPTNSTLLKRLILSLALLAMSSGPALSQGKAPTRNDVDAARQSGASVKTITRIFGQLLMFSFPRGFKPAFEDAKGGQYIQESVLDGESTKKWSQMLTVTGAKGLASNPNVSPQLFANKMAGGYKNACPSSFSGAGLGAFKIGVHDAFAAVVSCGVANPAGEAHSESMLLIVVKGQSDYYTIQWAERSTASTAPIKIDDAKWQGRLKQLAPIKLCPVVPGEAAPYPSCVERA